VSWMFAYAELMGEVLLRRYRAQPARLVGYHRWFNHGSTLLWGSPEHPCPIVGLSNGGECWGLAFEVPWVDRRRMLRRLEPNEGSPEYAKRQLPVELQTGSAQRATVWVSQPAVAERARWSNPELVEEALLAAHGTAGRGVEYLRTIVQALELWGMRDPMLEPIWEHLASWRPR
jgi:glutathione-specific gamma-glutamylcyclotransferase